MNVKATPTQLGAGRPAPLLAAAAGIMCFSVMDATMKRATMVTGVYDALLLRSLIGAALLAPVWLAQRRRWPAPRLLAIHILRGVVSTGVSATFFWGLKRTPMAQAMAVSFVAPVIALWLAAAILGERVRWPAIAAAGLGLAGVTVITAARIAGISGGDHHDAAWGIAAILVSSVLYAVNLIFQRRQAQLTSPVEVALFQALVMGVLLTVMWPWLGGAVPVRALGWIAASAVLVTIALMLLAWGWARAEAQVLLPIEYTAFLWAALTGWFAFGEALTAATLAGVALIVAGCWLGTRGAAGQPPATDHIEQTAV